MMYDILQLMNIIGGKFRNNLGNEISIHIIYIN